MNSSRLSKARATEVQAARSTTSAGEPDHFGSRCAGGAATGAARVLVLGSERAEFGMLADAAREVRAVRADEVLEPPGSLAGAGREYVRGVTKEALVVLDGAVLLQDRRLFIDQDLHTGP
jgi:chemotaxis signal transduction protein